MSWRKYRFEVRGVLEPAQAFRVGSGEQLYWHTDAPILRGPDDQPYIPGSSIRGVLAHALLDEAPLLGIGVARWKCLFGHTPSKREDAPSALGRFTIEDAVLNDPPPEKNAHTEVRDHVKINRQWNAAADGAKFDEEVVAGPSLRFRFHAAYEGDSSDNHELALLLAGLRMLVAGELSLGAKSGCGYGLVKLAEAKCRSFDRGQSDDLAAWFGTRLNPRWDDDWPNELPNAQPAGDPMASPDAVCILDFHLRLHFEGPLLVRAPLPPAPPASDEECKPNQHSAFGQYGQKVADAVFIQSKATGGYYLPGSSLRGVLRSHAERIASTLIKMPNPAELLFGPELGEERHEKRFKGRIEVYDGTLHRDGAPVYFDHVAIDRITAAAADTAKFSTTALGSPEIDTSVRIRFRPSDVNDKRALALWFFLLRDLLRDNGSPYWIGSGTARGYGYLRRAEITGVRANLLSSFMEQPAVSFPGRNPIDLPGRRIFELGATSFAELQPLWKAANEAWKGAAA